MIDFWNGRYREKEYAYGARPNDFLQEILAKRSAGKLLLPAEGEGRNATYASLAGWEVEAFDFSDEGRKKAMKLAERSKVSFLYQLTDFNSFSPKIAPFDLIALIYSHTAPDVRTSFNKKLIDFLKSGGELILEGFSKNQLGRGSGGPKAAEMLWSIDELVKDFEPLAIDYAEELIVTLNEGSYHQGSASVVRMVVRKEK